MSATNPTGAITLLELVSRSAQASRINTIENSVRGAGFGQKNFEARWSGYDLHNQPTVSYKGKKYNIASSAYASKRRGEKLNLRSGPRFLSGAWR